MPWSMASTAAPITSSCPISTPPATARRAPSSSCASSTTRKGGAASRWPFAPISTSRTRSRRSGATWLDRQNIAREPVALGETRLRRRGSRRDAAPRRSSGRAGLRRAPGTARHLQPQDLIETLRRRELDALGEKLAAETGQPFNARRAAGEYVAGTYRQRFTLASGRFAMIDDGLGFQLVPWTPSLEKQLGRHVSGVARGDGGIDWSFGRNRGLGL